MDFLDFTKEGVGE